ncbi:MAG: Hsp20/alpha crystallin family protein [Verrucomicrobia bacterium]|nr:Hsp20/alpha crystallin family protein [Verrucomicrobiota bacterium]
MNAEFQPNHDDATAPSAARQNNPNAAAVGAVAHRRPRLDRALLIAVLAMQCVLLAVLGWYFIANHSESRRQHESLGNLPTATTPPNRGSLVLPSDPTSQSASAARAQAPAPTPTPQLATHDILEHFARMQADADRQMLALFPPRFTQRHALPGMAAPASELDLHINRMMENAMQEFRALESSMRFDEGWSALGRSPTLDMQDAGREYVVVCSLPGLDDTDINVTLEGRLLTILGQSSSTARHPLESVQFERRIWLPGAVDEGHNASAMLTNGVLRIVVPKADSMPQVAKLTRLM